MKIGTHYMEKITHSKSESQQKPAKGQVHNFATGSEFTLFATMMLDLFSPLMENFLRWWM